MQTSTLAVHKADKPKMTRTFSTFLPRFLLISVSLGYCTLQKYKPTDKEQLG